MYVVCMYSDIVHTYCTKYLGVYSYKKSTFREYVQYTTTLHTYYALLHIPQYLLHTVIQSNRFAFHDNSDRHWFHLMIILK